MSYNFVVEALLNEYLKIYEAAEAEGGEDEGRGKTIALFGAILTCGKFVVPMPKWVVDELTKVMNSWFSLKVGSLDEAFSITPLPRKSNENRRRNTLLRHKLHTRIAELKAEGKRIPWAALAKEFGKSKSALQDLYYAQLPTFPEKS